MPPKMTLERLAEMLQAQFLAIQEQFEAMNFKLDQKADKSDITRLEIQLDQKADKDDIRSINYKIDGLATRLDRVEAVLQIENRLAF